MINLKMMGSGAMESVSGFTVSPVVTAVLWLHKQLARGFVKHKKYGKKYSILFVQSDPNT